MEEKRKYFVIAIQKIENEEAFKYKNNFQFLSVTYVDFVIAQHPVRDKEISEYIFLTGSADINFSEAASSSQTDKWNEIYINPRNILLLAQRQLSVPLCDKRKLFRH